MFVEVVALGSGVPVILASAVGLLVARRGRDDAAGEVLAPARPALGLVTSAALEDLPLVAPGRAGYGTATHLLIQAALERRTAVGPTNPTSPAVPVPDSRAARRPQWSAFYDVRR